jgi:Iron-containing redox enzyme
MQSASICQMTQRERFYHLVNLGKYPAYYSQAADIALEYLNTLEIKPQFVYSPSEFNQWLKDQYYQGLKDMRKGHWLDTGHLSNGKVVSRFSDRSVKERLLQNTPNNFVDGAWLDRVMPCGTATQVEAILFQIRYEEGGNGNIDENHPNLYSKLLSSLGMQIPIVYSREFSENHRFLDSAFEQPVFQIAVGLYPRQFLPELLGLTLWFEWNSTPSACQFAKCLRGRGIDDTYYKIHQRVDNPDRGHGFLARQAVEIYLEDIKQKGDDVQSHWKRIWQGYHTWDSLNVAFERDLQEHLVALEGKS